MTARRESLTAVQRSTRARAAAHTRWAQEPDRKAATKPARKGFMARWENQVDPERKLAADIRAKLADSAMRSYMSSLALRSSKAAKARAKPA